MESKVTVDTLEFEKRQSRTLAVLGLIFFYSDTPHMQTHAHTYTHIDRPRFLVIKSVNF